MEKCNFSEKAAVKCCGTHVRIRPRRLSQILDMPVTTTLNSTYVTLSLFKFAAHRAQPQPALTLAIPFP